MTTRPERPHDDRIPGAAHEGRGDDDRSTVAALLGRAPGGRFTVVVRDPAGVPSVIANEPFLADGTPMPTRYWLVDAELREAVSRLEAAGGVRAAAAAVPVAALARAHERYAAERDALVPPGHRGPRPTGGVGGTRSGVKCLHAHLAWWLAGGDDPVGEWVAGRLGVGRPDPGAVPRWRAAGRERAPAGGGAERRARDRREGEEGLTRGPAHG